MFVYDTEVRCAAGAYRCYGYPMLDRLTEDLAQAVQVVDARSPVAINQ
jgi:hypothetical protein